MKQERQRSEDFLHHVRHALVGIYYERKKLLNDMLCIANALDSKWKPNFLKSLWITLSIRRQLSSIRRMDDFLDRLQDAFIREERRNK